MPSTLLDLAHRLRFYSKLLQPLSRTQSLQLDLAMRQFGTVLAGGLECGKVYFNNNRAQAVAFVSQVVCVISGGGSSGAAPLKL